MIGLRKAVGAAARNSWLKRNAPLLRTPLDPGRPRLLVDVSVIYGHDAQTGIQRVVRAVWAELLRRGGETFDIVPVFATATTGYCYAPADFLAPGKRPIHSEPARVAPGDRFLGLDLSAHLLPKYLPQIRAWRANGASLHVIVYDLLPLLHPEWFSRASATNFRNWLDVIATDVDHAICISAKVAADLRQRLDAVAAAHHPKITRAPLGSDIASSLPSRGMSPVVKAVLDQAKRRPSILMVGTVEPRKGYDIALRAFEHLWNARPDDAPDLVIVGKQGWRTASLQAELRSHPERGRRLHWMQDVSDEALCLLYEHCRGVFVASRDEGFGLPLVEGVSHGRPVLARDLPVFREQGFKSVRYFRDDRPQALAGPLMALAQEREKIAVPADLPTWAACVDVILKQIGLRDDAPAQATSSVAAPALRSAHG